MTPDSVPIMEFLDRICDEMRDGFDRVDKRLDRFETLFATKEEVKTQVQRAAAERQGLADDIRDVDRRLSERIKTLEGNFTKLLWAVAGGVLVVLLGFVMWFVQFVITGTTTFSLNGTEEVIHHAYQHLC